MAVIRSQNKDFQNCWLNLLCRQVVCSQSKPEIQLGPSNQGLGGRASNQDVVLSKRGDYR